MRGAEVKEASATISNTTTSISFNNIVARPEKWIIVKATDDLNSEGYSSTGWQSVVDNSYLNLLVIGYNGNEYFQSGYHTNSSDSLNGGIIGSTENTTTYTNTTFTIRPGYWHYAYGSGGKVGYQCCFSPGTYQLFYI